MPLSKNKKPNQPKTSVKSIPSKSTSGKPLRPVPTGFDADFSKSLPTTFHNFTGGTTTSSTAKRNPFGRLRPTEQQQQRPQFYSATASFEKRRGKSPASRNQSTGQTKVQKNQSTQKTKKKLTPSTENAAANIGTEGQDQSSPKLLQSLLTIENLLEAAAESNLNVLGNEDTGRPNSNEGKTAKEFTDSRLSVTETNESTSIEATSLEATSLDSSSKVWSLLNNGHFDLSSLGSGNKSFISFENKSSDQLDGFSCGSATSKLWNILNSDTNSNFRFETSSIGSNGSNIQLIPCADSTGNNSVKNAKFNFQFDSTSSAMKLSSDNSVGSTKISNRKSDMKSSADSDSSSTKISNRKSDIGNSCSNDLKHAGTESIDSNTKKNKLYFRDNSSKLVTSESVGSSGSKKKLSFKNISANVMKPSCNDSVTSNASKKVKLLLKNHSSRAKTNVTNGNPSENDSVSTNSRKIKISLKNLSGPSSLLDLNDIKLGSNDSAASSRRSKISFKNQRGVPSDLSEINFEDMKSTGGESLVTGSKIKLPLKNFPSTSTKSSSVVNDKQSSIINAVGKDSTNINLLPTSNSVSSNSKKINLLRKSIVGSDSRNYKSKTGLSVDDIKLGSGNTLASGSKMSSFDLDFELSRTMATSDNAESMGSRKDKTTGDSCSTKKSNYDMSADSVGSNSNIKKKIATDASLSSAGSSTGTEKKNNCLDFQFNLSSSGSKGINLSDLNLKISNSNPASKMKGINYGDKKLTTTSAASKSFTLKSTCTADSVSSGRSNPSVFQSIQSDCSREAAGVCDNNSKKRKITQGMFDDISKAVPSSSPGVSVPDYNDANTCTADSVSSSSIPKRKVVNKKKSSGDSVSSSRKKIRMYSQTSQVEASSRSKDDNSLSRQSNNVKTMQPPNFPMDPSNTNLPLTKLASDQFDITSSNCSNNVWNLHKFDSAKESATFDKNLSDGIFSCSNTSKLWSMLSSQDSQSLSFGSSSKSNESHRLSDLSLALGTSSKPAGVTLESNATPTTKHGGSKNVTASQGEMNKVWSLINGDKFSINNLLDASAVKNNISLLGDFKTDGPSKLKLNKSYDDSNILHSLKDTKLPSLPSNVAGNMTHKDQRIPVFTDEKYSSDCGPGNPINRENPSDKTFHLLDMSEDKKKFYDNFNHRCNQTVKEQQILMGSVPSLSILGQLNFFDKGLKEYEQLMNEFISDTQESFMSGNEEETSAEASTGGPRKSKLEVMLVKALGFYRLESTSFMKKCLLNSQHQQFEIEECSMPYLDFLYQAVEMQMQNLNSFSPLSSLLPNSEHENAVLPNINSDARYQTSSMIPTPTGAMNSEETSSINTFYNIDDSSSQPRKLSFFSNNKAKETGSTSKHFDASASSQQFIANVTNKKIPRQDTNVIEESNWWENETNFTNTNTARIHISSKSTIYSLTSLSDARKKVVLKMFHVTNSLPIQRPNSKELETEYALTKNISHHGIRKTYKKSYVENNPSLVLEYVEGKTLFEVGKICSVVRVLKIAYKIVDALNALHKEQIIHGSLSTDHILLMPPKDGCVEEQIKIIDFSHSFRFSNKSFTWSPGLQQFRHPSLHRRHHEEGILSQLSLLRMLHCIAPEQTGKLNRPVDFRTDFYSVGVILYFLFTGSFPFAISSSNFDRAVEELLQQNLSVEAELLSNVKLGISDHVAKFVKKLMSKNGDERYQSAEGILFDIDRLISICQDNILGTLSLQFVLGKGDYSEHFLVPQKLYGRDNEKATILSSINRASQNNNGRDGRNYLNSTPASEWGMFSPESNKMFNRPVEMVLVAGPSGSGKTALVFDVCSSIVRHGGLFVHGKFHTSPYCFDNEESNIIHDQIQPYSAFIEASCAICDHLLLESSKDLLERVKPSIMKALKDEGKLLTNIIPSLESIVGEQKDTDEISGYEVKNRFHYVFCKFIRCISNNVIPLVIFIDDLHRSDPDSLELLKAIMLDIRIKNLVIIGAYLESPSKSEVVSLNFVLNEMQDYGISTTRINLPPFSIDCIRLLIQESMKVSNPNETDYYSLSLLVKNRTKGNVFLVLQMLKYLIDEKLINFNHQERKWKWDIHKINFTLFGTYGAGSSGFESKNNGFDPFKIIIDKHLNNESKNVLKYASCMATPSFSSSALKLVMNNSGCIDIDGALATLVSESILIEVPAESKTPSLNFYNEPTSFYQFAQDQIHGVAYSMIPLDERNSLYFCIGLTLLGYFTSNKNQIPDSKLFDIVYFLNSALKDINRFLPSFSSKVRLRNEEDFVKNIVSLNLKAGRKAIISAAFFFASKYFKHALELLNFLESRNVINSKVSDVSLWNPSNQEMYEMVLQVYTLSAEVYYCTKDFTAMNQAIETVMQKSKNLNDRAPLHILRIRALSDLHQEANAIDNGLYALRELGENISSGLENIPVNIAETVPMLCDKLSDIMNFQLMQDQGALSKALILAEMIRPIYSRKPLYLKWVLYRIIQLTLQYGVCPKASIQGIATYGVLLCGDFQTVKAGFHLGQLALSLLDKFKSKEFIPKVYLPVFFLINHWEAHIHSSIKPLIDASKIGLQVGLHNMSIDCINAYCMYSFISGKYPLEKLYSEFSSFMQHNKNMPVTTPAFLSHFHAVRTFLSDDEKFHTDNSDLDANSDQSNTETDKVLYFFPPLMISIYFYDFRRAAECSEKCRSSLPYIYGTYHLSLFTFYDGLIAVEMARATQQGNACDNNSNISSVSILVEIVNECIEKIKNWSKNAPDNFLNKLYLLEAEVAALQCNERIALEKYEKAIEFSQRCSFIHEEALAFERMGMYFLRKKPACDSDRASQSLSKACAAYKRWGARAKVNHLKSLYPSLIVMDNNASLSCESSIQSCGKNAFDEIFSYSSARSSRCGKDSFVAAESKNANNISTRNYASMDATGTDNRFDESSPAAQANDKSDSSDIASNSIFSDFTGSSAILNSGSLAEMFKVINSRHR